MGQRRARRGRWRCRSRRRARTSSAARPASAPSSDQLGDHLEVDLGERVEEAEHDPVRAGGARTRPAARAGGRPRRRRCRSRRAGAAAGVRAGSSPRGPARPAPAPARARPPRARCPGSASPTRLTRSAPPASARSASGAWVTTTSSSAAHTGSSPVVRGAEPRVRSAYGAPSSASIVATDGSADGLQPGGDRARPRASTRRTLPWVSATRSSLRPAALAQRVEQRRVARDVLEPDRGRGRAVEVAAEPDVGDPGDLAHVLDVGDHVGQRRRRAGPRVRVPERLERLEVARVDARGAARRRGPRPTSAAAAGLTKRGTKVTMHTPPLSAQAAQDVVGDVPGVVGDGAGAGVAEDDRGRRDVERVVHRRRRDVGEVDEHPEPVQLGDDLAAEAGQPAVARARRSRRRPRPVLALWVRVR